MFTGARQPLREAVSWNDREQALADIDAVSLFVRLWVEIKDEDNQQYYQCVSLFVRLWVEMLLQSYFLDGKKRQPLREAVSWNSFYPFYQVLQECQPLREAVSWNAAPETLKNLHNCQPLREAVSWNFMNNGDLKYAIGQPLREAVSWNNN